MRGESLPKDIATGGLLRESLDLWKDDWIEIDIDVSILVNAAITAMILYGVWSQKMTFALIIGMIAYAISKVIELKVKNLTFFRRKPLAK